MMKAVLRGAMGVFAAFLIAGCSTVETRDYPETKDVIRVVDGTVDPRADLQGNSLVIFCSEAPGICFDITRNGGNAVDRANAVVGKEAFAAFVMSPGTYILNHRKEFIVRNQKINVFELTADTIRPISKELFLDKYDDAFLPVTLDSTLDGVVPSIRALTPSTPAIQKIGWYTGKTCYWIVASPVYAAYYTVRGALWLLVLRFAAVSKGEIMVDSKGTIIEWGQNLPVQPPASVLDTGTPGRVKVL
ncbi:MAG: hypothetical protein MJ016_02725 [Victivallaceae bacterium]|nr:hypothetical protein [Victivallaceae bacterium]